MVYNNRRHARCTCIYNPARYRGKPQQLNTLPRHSHTQKAARLRWNARLTEDCSAMKTITWSISQEVQVSCVRNLVVQKRPTTSFLIRT